MSSTHDILAEFTNLPPGFIEDITGTKPVDLLRDDDDIVTVEGPFATSGSVACAEVAPPRAMTEREIFVAERRSGIGGSDAATVLGLNPYKPT